MRPDLCKIKDIVTEFLSLLRRHRLLINKEIFVSCCHSYTWMIDVDIHNVHSPRRIIFGLDGIEKILNAIIRVRTG
jgi:hypothetical protein